MVTISTFSSEARIGSSLVGTEAGLFINLVQGLRLSILRNDLGQVIQSLFSGNPDSGLF